MPKFKNIKKQKIHVPKKRPEKFDHFCDCVETLSKSVYMIVRGSDTKDKKGINWITIGTGFLVSPNRLLTASHVINNPSGCQHKDGDKYYLVRRDSIENFHWHIFEPKINKEIFVYPEKDLAIIYLNNDFYQKDNKVFVDKNEFIRISKDLQPIGKDIGILGYPLCALQFDNGDLGKPKIGDILLRTDKGVINCKYKTSDIDFHYEFTMAFNPGNSGGPIFDVRNGRLVSVVQGFKAIPIANNEIIISEKYKKTLKQYKESSYIDTVHANYSFGWSVISFLEIFKKHNIL